jgi:hypothetical protein
MTRNRSRSGKPKDAVAAGLRLARELFSECGCERSLPRPHESFAQQFEGDARGREAGADVAAGPPRCQSGGGCRRGADDAVGAMAAPGVVASYLMGVVVGHSEVSFLGVDLHAS